MKGLVIILLLGPISYYIAEIMNRYGTRFFWLNIMLIGLYGYAIFGVVNL